MRPLRQVGALAGSAEEAEALALLHDAARHDARFEHGREPALFDPVPGATQIPLIAKCWQASNARRIRLQKAAKVPA